MQWITSTDPSMSNSVSAFDEWDNPITGDINLRTPANDGWTFVGNANQEFLGLAPRSGFDATGPITGVSGWAPTDSAAFTTSATLDGISLATLNDVNSLESLLNASINSKVTTAINNYQKKVSVSDRFAMGGGVLTFTFTNNNEGTFPAVQTIPLPTFESDGVSATEAQCKWLVAPIYQVFNDYTSGGHTYQHFVYSTNPMTSRTFAARTDTDNSGSGDTLTCQIGYIIIARR